ncbi:large ribosomal subunit protein uL4m [Cloeon dipterum]
MLQNISKLFRNCGHRFLLPKFPMSTLESIESNPLDSELVPPSSSLAKSQNFKRKLEFMPPNMEPKQAWLENLNTTDEEKISILELHPQVFGSMPRIDVIHKNVRWQTLYGRMDLRQAASRAELPGGGRKPWPQKGLGRARHGSNRSPLFYNGGKAHGPRAPKSYFYMLPYDLRVLGLTTTLSVKLAQDDLHIVESLDIPTDDQQYIEELVQARMWGPSVLFVDEQDVMPENITKATENTRHFNLMPAYGLNVFSMLKHDTLVLTLAALNRIEHQLLLNIHRNKNGKHQFRYMPSHH